MKYDTSVLDLIKARRSTRTYTGDEIPPELLAQLEKACTRLNRGPFGVAARFKVFERSVKKEDKVSLGDHGLQKNARYFIIGAVKRSPTALEGFGYLVEHLVLKATELGLGTCWMGYFNREFFSIFKTDTEELFPAVVNVGVAAKGSRFGERMIRSAIGANRRKDWKELFFLDDFSRPMRKDEADRYSEPLEMLRLSPSSGNSQPWRIIRERGHDTFHFYLKKVKPAYYEAGMHNLDIGICMCHFELAALELGLKGQWRRATQTIKNTPMDNEYRVTWVGGA